MRSNNQLRGLVHPVPNPIQRKTKDEMQDDGRWNDGWRHDGRDGSRLVADRGGAGARSDRLGQIHPLNRWKIEVRRDAE